MLSSAVGVLFDGFAYGMLLFLLSVGLSVTLGMMNFVNLAHCSFAMVGGYTTVTLVNKLGWPFLATLPLAFVVAAVASVVLERTLFRRLYRSTDLDQGLFTIGRNNNFIGKVVLIQRRYRELNVSRVVFDEQDAPQGLHLSLS